MINARKTASKRAIKKTVITIGDLICNTIADKFTNASKKSLWRDCILRNYIQRSCTHKII